MSRAFPFGGTAITAALKHAYEQFSNSSHRALRRIIDLSGDGEISVGTMPNTVRDRIIANGVTINGLPILNEIPNLDKKVDLNDYMELAASWMSEPNQPAYNEDCDIFEDDIINGLDLSLFLKNWLVE